MQSKNAFVLAAGLFISGASFAGPVVSGFNSNTLAENDDFYTGLVNIGFTVNFFGNEYSQLYVNNNGNVTFDSPLGTYTPFDLTTTGRVIVAPFFADVDTSYAGSPVTYGIGEYDGQAAFGVNWVNVDYYYSDPSHTARNSFQLILVDRSDGDFDIVFNYDSIQWETGMASYGSPDGLGGYSARVGWSNGTGGEGSFYELAGSAINGAFLNGGPNALAGKRYIFEVRNGIVSPPIPVPEPETWAMLLAGLGIVGVTAKRRRRQG
ncbi:MAG: PEPxxWA-CTERM sorting domain-containing protein [Proteobacteria bacterium]|nr:PEPxxWA-CTERM sorting domain-containing protein [Pseudomonadota bacterium]